MATLTRRSFIQNGATMVAAGMAVPSFIAETARVIENGGQTTPTAHAAGRRILVLVQLQGGNDGMNTLIPYGDPAYYQARPSLAIPQGQVLPLSGYAGLHPSLSRMKSRWDRGQLAVVQGVGYPNPSRSHFRGTDIWNSAVPDRLEPKGWMGRYFQSCGCQRPDHLEGLAVGTGTVPGAFWTEMSLVPAVASVSSFRYTGGDYTNATQRNMELQILRNALAQADGRPEAEFLRQSMTTALNDADILAQAAAGYTPVGAYPANGFGNSMKLTAQLIAADVGTSIFHVSLGSFDTHIAQPGEHASLLSTLDQGLDAFMVDMERAGKAGDVTVMTFSEFGRRVAQNESTGTDHGTAAPMLMLGGALNRGLFGTYPSLTDLTNGDLKMAVDFRSVYATMLEDWLSIPAATSANILGGSFPTLGIVWGTSPRGQLPAPPAPVTPAPAAPSNPAQCAPRPKVGVSAVADAGKLRVTLTAGSGNIRSLRIGEATNALVDVGNEIGITRNSTYTPGTPDPRLTFTVRRATPNAATNVPIVVTDDCGEWPTIVGGGPNAF